jgi:cytochrome oxidase Cu insertion factor (SCO1/SenC/PrrC family)
VPRSTPTAVRAQYLPPVGRDLAAAPNFSLDDQDGRKVTLQAYRGRTVLVTFMDPRCTGMCPIIGQELAALERQLPDAAIPPLLVVSVAPGRTGADVRHYMSSLTWRPGWHWLLGSQPQLAPVWAAYHVAVQATPEDVLHDQVLYVVDPQGRIRAGYSAPLPVDELTALIEKGLPR